MRTPKRVAYEFVDYVPDSLKEDTLYVSMRFATVVHLCPCGCGNEVVTPLSPADWRITFDGETITLYPSIGNWSLSCRSHYWIKRSEVAWAPQWTRKEIEAGRAKARTAKARYLGEPEPHPALETRKAEAASEPQALRFRERIKKWLR